VEVSPGSRSASTGATVHRLDGHFVLPAFIDVHVHGVEGYDTLDRGLPLATIARRLPRYGVGAFCPTTVACPPGALRRMLEQVSRLRAEPEAGSARVLPAHLESNFVAAEFRGAQPVECLRDPRTALDRLSGRLPMTNDVSFEGADILGEIERAAPDVGIVTLAPELDGALDLIKWLDARGHSVSLGHSAATYDEAVEAISAGARHATHLFNRMPPVRHRAPGLAGAVLESDDVAAELICDGAHVHPAMIRTAVRAKGPSRICVITDATAAAGLPPGGRAALGGRPIVAGDTTALLEDGTLAGGVMTMDRIFATLVAGVGISLVDAATMCSTTPARELGLVHHGMLAERAVADVVVLDAALAVVQTYVGGALVYERGLRR
jgi:N-acetylglucosamine-6-phosphate deacetylase